MSMPLKEVIKELGLIFDKARDLQDALNNNTVLPSRKSVNNTLREIWGTAHDLGKALEQAGIAEMWRKEYDNKCTRSRK